MGLPQTPSPPHLYPQALQLKLYQAFIFSIPILFSIILFLLFYLFYLKRRASSLSSPPPPIIPRGLSQATPFIHTSCDLMDLKGELKEKLPIVLFDEDLRARDSQCCVCLGDFEIKEELLQVPLCKHVFHIDCIHHWLCSNSTCPLCRCSIIIPTTKLGNPEPAPSVPQRPQQDNDNSNQHPQIVPSEQQRQQLQQQQQQQQQQVIQIEGSSSASTCLRDSGRFSMLSISMENEMGCPDQESVVLHIQMHNS